jgi:methionyl-tRNA synthetase
MSAQTFFITTAIDYTNAPPHIGHAYEKVLADVIARWHRERGRSVFFLTGVDQHGQKVQQSAEKAGVAPAEFARDITGCPAATA